MSSAKTGSSSAHRHRPTLKQKNKPFKSKAAAKKDGKVSKHKHSSTASLARSMGRHARKNQSKVLLTAKRQKLAAAKRIYAGKSGAPKIIAVVAVGFDTCARQFVREFCDVTAENSDFERLSEGVFFSRRFKQKLQFVTNDRPTSRHAFFANLDACLVADFVVFVCAGQAAEAADAFGKCFIKALVRQGVSAPLVVLQRGMRDANAKLIDALKASTLSFSKAHLPLIEDVYCLELPKDVADMQRCIFNNYPKGVSWRNARPYLTVDRVSWMPAHDETKTDLCVSGFVRGSRGFSPNNHVHIPGLGDFALRSVSQDHCFSTSETMATDAIQFADVPADDAISSSDQDFSASDDEEMQDADSVLATSKNEIVRKVRVPKGTSAYQAAWFIDDEDYDCEEEEADCMPCDVPEPQESHAESMQTSDNAASCDDDIVESDEYEEIEVQKQKKVAFADLDHDEEAADYEMYKSQQQNDEIDFKYPDQVDLDPNSRLLAKDRYAKYRSVRSLRYADWDPRENLPKEFSGLHTFQNLVLSKRRAYAENNAIFEPGTFVTLRIANVNREAFEAHIKQTSPSVFAVFGLLKHEHRLTLMHASLNTVAAEEDTTNDCEQIAIKNKESLLLCVGFRRFLTNPILSEFSTGNAHKLCRFVGHKSNAVASFYAPVSFGTLPVLAFKMAFGNEDCALSSEILPLIASGSVLDPNPLRIIAKRITFTGVPYKIHKRTSVIRYMFFDAADVLYFKPVELVTKHGRIGHIKESLGTHGYMKCVFDKQIQHHDTILLNLYKRVFPKNTTQLFINNK